MRYLVARLLCLAPTSSALPLAAILEAQRPAASAGAIEGIVHSAMGAPLPAASVILCRPPDTTVVGHSVTAEDGAFRLAAAPGRYLVLVRRVGYHPSTPSAVTITGPDARIDLGIIRMRPSIVSLDSVEVRERRAAITMLADRNVYAASDMPATSGGTVIDVLRLVPELEVSVGGSVTTQGTTPRIHINGRPAPMQGEALTRFLQQLPAERIDRIEVISNPSARYSAEGQGGIVDIVMKKDASLGLSGSVALNLGSRNEKSGSANVTLQRETLTLFGGASAHFFRNDFENADLRQNLNAQPTSFIQQASRSRTSGRFGSLDFTAELSVGSRGTFWAEAGVGLDALSSDAVTAYTLLDDLRHPFQRYDRVNDTDARGSSRSLLVGYRDVVEPQQREWSIELRRSVNGDDNATESGRQWHHPHGEALDVPPELLQADAVQDQDELTLDASMMYPWGESGQLEVGYRGASRYTSDRFRMLVESPGTEGTDTESLGDFRHRERTHAAFVTASRRIGRVNVQVGVRAELANTRSSLPLDSTLFQNSHVGLFPSVNVSTPISATGQLRLTYSRRVDRPEAWALNPDMPVYDPLNRELGNPHLLPRYTQSLSVSLRRAGRLGMLQLSPFYRRTEDSWDQVRSVDGEGASTVTWRNLATTTSYGGTLTASAQQLGPASGFVSVSAYREVRTERDSSEDFAGSATRISANGTFTVRATSALSVQGSLSYFPARTVPQGRISAMVFSTVGARLRVWDGRGSINLAVVDPFELQRYTFTTRDRTHVQRSSSSLSARRATLGITYSFGRPPDSRRPDDRAKEEDQQQDARRIR